MAHPGSRLQHLKAAVALVAVVQAQGDNWLRRGRTSPRCARSMTTRNAVLCDLAGEKPVHHRSGCNAGGIVLNWVMKNTKTEPA